MCVQRSECNGQQQPGDYLCTDNLPTGHDRSHEGRDGNETQQNHSEGIFSFFVFELFSVLARGLLLGISC